MYHNDDEEIMGHDDVIDIDELNEFMGEHGYELPQEDDEILDIGDRVRDQKNWKLFKLYAIIMNDFRVQPYITEYEAHIDRLNQ